MIHFYTDPHLGVTRSAHTTQASSAALQQALYEQATLAASHGSGLCVCLGDLFDNFSNPEHVHLQGMSVMSRTNLTMAGNHDVVNQAGKIGTLQLLNEHWSVLASQPRALFAEFGRIMVHDWKLDKDKAVIVFVPHIATQQLFLEALMEASTRAEQAPKGYTTMLCLHANYNFPEDRLNDSTLNLTEENAARVLERFNYILMGHEHQPAQHLDGRLIIIGNTHPTSLADISDKRTLTFENGEFKEQSIWFQDSGYVELEASGIPKACSANFARVKGRADATGMLDVMKAVNEMWRRSPALYALKMEVELDGVVGPSDTKAVGLAQLPELIRKELESTPALLALWDSLVTA